MESFILQSGMVSATLQIVLERFSNFAQKELGILLGADEELKKLERTVLKVQAVVNNIRSKQHHSSIRKAQQLWLGDVQCVLYDADDLLDEIALGISELGTNHDNVDFTNIDGLRKLIFSRFKFSIASEIVNIQQKLDDIAKERKGFSTDDSVKLRQSISMGLLQTTSLVDKSSIVGREKDTDEVLKLLFSDDVEVQSISVVTIVGMAGVGKTTIAQLVYNNVDVMNKFDIRIWVSISMEDCSVERITNAVVQHASGKLSDFSDLDSSQMRLQETLKGKRFLIVFDGMWNENANDWDMLCLPFKVAAQGSKLLVTTRSMHVARIVATAPAYHVQTLKDGECWELIKQRAFFRDKHNSLEGIGLKIAKKCKGSPLVGSVLGGALRFKYDEIEWDVILKSKIWDILENEDRILPALKVSYGRLAPCLKRCFTYCSVFPTDFEFKKDDLVQFWVSEGFVQPRGVRRIEDIGREYFDVLYSRSFFQLSSADHPNHPIYRMHSLIHELAEFICDGVCLRIEEDDMSRLCPNFRNVRHASLICKDNNPESFKVFQKCGRLRTVMLFSKSGCQMDRIPPEFFPNLPYIRVLNLSFVNITQLPDSVSTMKHLRHLDVSSTPIETLPEPITDLHGMEILKLNNCIRLSNLPKNMKNLTNLRCLELDINLNVRFMPLEFGKLINLQTLSGFIVGKEAGRRINELEEMNTLCGSICITHIENVPNMIEARTAKLELKTNLDELQLQWDVLQDSQTAQGVLAGLEPHERVKRVTIWGYGGYLFPGWLGNPMFCCLEMISLQHCPNCKVFPSLGKLLVLKYLLIEDLSDLMHLEFEESSFPSLQSLTIHNMKNLQEWDLKPGVMPNLYQLTIMKCPTLNFLPPLHYLASLECLKINNCHKLQCMPTGGLPNSLKCLIIKHSSILRERCKVDRGEDWRKICSIPEVVIDHE